MWIKNKIVKNASWIIGCRILQSVIALIVNMITARFLGPSNYGLISYAASIVAFFVPIMTLGINNVLTNEIIKYPEREGETIGTSMGLSFISSIFCIVGVITFVSFVNAGEKETFLVCFLYSLILISQSFELIQYWFQAKLLSKYVAITTLMIFIFISMFRIYLVVSGKDVYWFAVSNAIDYLLIAVVLLVVYKVKAEQKILFSFSAAKRIFAQSKHYIIAGLMGVVLAQSDRVMLKLIIDNNAVGYYSAAYNVAGLTSFVFSAIIDSFRPSILEDKGKDEKKYKNSLSRLFGIIIYLSIFQCLVLSIFARLVVDIMYGADYFEAIAVLQIIVWYTAFSYFGAVRSVWVLAEGKQKYLWVISLSGMVINIVLNIIFIPYFGALGAAVATLITQILNNVVINWIIPSFSEVNLLAVKGLKWKNIFKRDNEIN